MKILILQLEPG